MPGIPTHSPETAEKPQKSMALLSAQGATARLKYTRSARAEVSLAEFVPYTTHVTRRVVKLKSGDYAAVLRLQGAAHESADARDLNIWHEQLNNFLRNIASDQVAVWSHVVRRPYSEFPEGEFPPGFARDLNEKYRARVELEHSLVNELYLTLIYRPASGRSGRLMDLIWRPQASEATERQADEIALVDELLDAALSGLERYEPDVLTCYERGGQLYSELEEFFGFLLDGSWTRRPVARRSIAGGLATVRPFFGRSGLIALVGGSGTHYANALAIQEYPAITCPGILNDLLSRPYAFVLSQSFTFISRSAGLARMERQRARLVNAGDVAVSQVESIASAMDDLASGRFVLGAHSLSLLVRGADERALAEHVGDAGKCLADAGIKWAREDLGAAGAYFAQLPGNFTYRSRISEITSRNFAGFSSFHNYPIGHIRHNQWGPAVTVFRTSSGAPYFFNWHKGEDGSEQKRAAKLDPNHKDLANTIIIGKSGTGKTAIQMFLLAQSLKFCNPSARGGNRLSAVFFDKDLGASVGIRAMGGIYFPLKNGVPSGWNPFQLDPTEDNLTFLEKLVRRLVHRADSPLTPAEEKEIFDAIRGVMGAPKPLRRLRAVLQFLPPSDPAGVHARLSRWAGPSAPLGWLFDNPEDTLSVEGNALIGFDVTEFLPNDETREPTIMYLFHRVSKLLDGRRVPIFFDEFGQLSKDTAFQELIENKLVTIRKQDGFVIMGTQMPGQVIRSPIAGAVIQQTATKIFLPNPEADRDEYVSGFKLSDREFELIKSFGEKSRLFLVKQGSNSVVVEFRLQGFEDELAVLSGNTATATVVEQLVAERGHEPANWLAEFHRRRKT